MMKRNHSSSPEDYNQVDTAVVQGGAPADNTSKGVPASKSNKRVKLDLDDWEALFHRLGKYKGQHGHCSVPLQNDNDPELGVWGK
jgi:Helicase associated domain